jgi:HD-GYP domain-containing protein (c-di-GMP phosphodiesterase class II)
MRVSDVVSGALAAIRQGTFDAEDLNLLTTLANMASKAIESAQLHQQLRESYYKTLHVLMRSLAARDAYSAAHGEAVTWLALRLAERLGLGERAAEALEAYGPLHDLGKIGIADAVLLKQGPLTEEELEMCHQHAVIGEDIIHPLNPGPEALAMIRSHHEWWDGSGYPDGSKREQIPLLARVVAVADACHAMVSDRPYRRGAILLEAVQQIQAMAGTQFDPAVVDALTNLWESSELPRFPMQPDQSAEREDMLDLPPSLVAPRFCLH